jgi:hypothetical protein
MGFIKKAASWVGKTVGGVVGGLVGGVAKGSGSTNQFSVDPNAFGVSAARINFSANPVVNSFQAQAFLNDFKAKQAQLDESNYQGAIANAMAQLTGGAGPATGTIGQMGTLADALRAQMAGTGPSLAQLQLQSGLEQNKQAMASSIGSQRGINTGLAQRSIQEQGAQANQSVVNQSAQIRMAEQLAAQEQLGALLSNTGALQVGQQQAATSMLGTAGGLQGAQNDARIANLMGSQSLDLQAILANQGAKMQAQNVNAGVSAQNADLKQAAQAINADIARANAGYSQAASSASAANRLQATGINAGIAGQNAQSNANMVGGLLQGGAMALPFFLSQGGSVPERGSGYGMGSGMPDYDPDDEWMYGTGMTAMDWYRKIMEQTAPGGGIGGGMAKAMPAFAKGMASMPLKGGIAHGGAIDGRMGGMVPGQAMVPGDDPRNDTVTAKVSPGEIVVPRTIAQSENAPEKAAEFVEAVKRGRGKPRRAH